MKAVKYIYHFSYIFMLVLLGCDNSSVEIKTVNTQQEVVEVKPLEIPKDNGQNIIYSGPLTSESIKKIYGTECSNGLCVIDTQPNIAPISRENGSSICARAKYESITIVTAYFSRENQIEGADCEISESDYGSIIKQYGELSVFKKYLDQQTDIDFKTWETESGYVTTYKKIIGRDPQGGVMYEFHIYTGPNENRNYSKYTK